jgi:hypothetical protein
MIIIRDNVIISRRTNISTVGRGQFRKTVVGKHEIVLLKAEKKPASLNVLPFILG